MQILPFEKYVCVRTSSYIRRLPEHFQFLQGGSLVKSHYFSILHLIFITFTYLKLLNYDFIINQLCY